MFDWSAFWLAVVLAMFGVSVLVYMITSFRIWLLIMYCFGVLLIGSAIIMVATGAI